MKARPVTKEQILNLIAELLKFPEPEICRHAVCCDLLNLLETNGHKLNKSLVKAIVESDDNLAIQLLKKAGDQ